MVNELRLLGETTSDGLAVAEFQVEPEGSGKGIRFRYLNQVMNHWLGVSEGLGARLSGQALLVEGEMPELYQISEMESVIETGNPVTFKVFCMKIRGFLEVLLWRTGPQEFAMLVKRKGAVPPDHSEEAAVSRMNRHQAEAGFRFLIDNMTDVLWRLDGDFRYTYVSASDTLMRGYAAEEVLRRPIWDFLTPDGTERLRRVHQMLMNVSRQSAQEPVRPMELQMVCKDGRLIWVELAFVPIFDNAGAFEGYQGIARDINQRRETQQSLEEFRLLMEAVLDNMAQAMIVVNGRREVAAFNKKFLDLFGFNASEIVVGEPFEKPFRLWRSRRETSRESLETDFDGITAGRSFTREYWQTNEEGARIWVQLFHNPLPGGGFVRTYTDITDRKRYELDLYASREKLAVMASTDELTGVLNRRSGFAMMKHMEKACLEQRKSFSVCFIDIDDLKGVNDRFGHGEGDELIRILAETVKQCIRTDDAVCRVGGDEFMILFPRCTAEVAEQLVNRILDRLKEVAEAKGKPYQIRFSYGIESMTPEDPITLEDLIRRADRKMYRNKTKTKL